MKKLLPLAALCLLIAVTTQAIDKLSTSTQIFLTGITKDADDEVATMQRYGHAVSRVQGREMADVFITLRGHSTARIEALGGVVNANFGDSLITAQVPVDEIEEISQLPEVAQLAIAERGVEDCDTMLSVTNTGIINNAYNMGFAPQNYTGKGVVLGIIDSGFEFNNLAFCDSLGHTRIKRVYMPNRSDGNKVTLGRTTLPGSEFDSTMVYSLTTDSTKSSHGTNTLSIAAGSRVKAKHGTYSGMAPEADLVVCALAGKNTDVNYANSVNYIWNYANSVGKRCVINISGGIDEGAHRGNSNLCKALDLVGAQGAIIVLSSSNNAGSRTYYHHTFTGDDDSKPDGGTYFPYTNSTTHQYELYHSFYYSSSARDLGVQILVLDPNTDTIVAKSDVIKGYHYSYCGSEYKSKSTYDSTMTKYFHGTIGVWTRYSTSTNFCLHVEVNVTQATSTPYKIAYAFYGKKGERVDGWRTWKSSLYTAHAPIGDYTFQAGNDSCSVHDSNTGFKTISVGAHWSRGSYTTIGEVEKGKPFTGSGGIYAASGYGIDPNGNTYPFITAPGAYVMSCANAYYTSSNIYNPTYGDSITNPFTGRMEFYGVNTGTSMAAPCVAGIIASWLQYDPTLTLDSVRTLIKENAIVDDKVRATGLKFGNGKINALLPAMKAAYDNRPSAIATSAALADTASSSGKVYRIIDGDITGAYITRDGKTVYAHFAPADSSTTRRWMAINLSTSLPRYGDIKTWPGHLLNNVYSFFRPDTVNLEMTATMAVLKGDSTSNPIATYRPSDFAPQAMEVFHVDSAQWDAKNKRFITPIYSDSTLVEGAVPGAISHVNMSLYQGSGQDTVLQDRHIYRFLATARWNASNGAMILYPLENLQDLGKLTLPVRTLAAMLADSTIKSGVYYPIVDSTLTVVRVLEGDSVLLAKDDNLYPSPSVMDSTQVDYLKMKGIVPNSLIYDQSNWVKILLPEALDSTAVAGMLGHTLTGLEATLTDLHNPTLVASEMPTTGNKNDYTLNTFVPATFAGSQTVDSTSYFLVAPKPLEVATLTQAMWNDSTGRFEVPMYPDSSRLDGLQGSFKADWALYPDSVPALQHGRIYQFTGVVSDSLTVYPLDGLTDRGVLKMPATTLSAMLADSTIKSGVYYPIVDSTLTVVRVLEGDSVLLAKDDNLYPSPSVMDSTQVDYLKMKGIVPNSLIYDQSNWVKILLPEALDSTAVAGMLGHTLTGLEATLTDLHNPTLVASEMPTTGNKNDYTLNTFVPATFAGSQTVDSTSYFLVAPKPLEVATLTQAMWNDSTGRFEVPMYPDSSRLDGLQGSFKADWALYPDSVPALQHGRIYQFTGVVSDSLTVYPLDGLTDITPKNLRRDLTDDGIVDVADVTELINYIVGSSPLTCDPKEADLNGDGIYDVADVTELINIILGN